MPRVEAKPRDASATRGRILAAAIEEFSRHGLAGARIDRIAEAAAANKRAIYEHFGDKEGLFAAAMDAAVEELMADVPLTEDDLPGYVGRLFDHHREHPQTMRLHLWRQLERPSAGPDSVDLYAEKLAAMGSGRIAGLDRLVLITTLAYGWMLAPEDLFAAAAGDPASAERLAAHREALVEAARRIVA